jgi:hypothetical protein
MSEGLSIRPQTLHLSPRYRRLRDSILRPHLRLTESRYFWERWKARLGPDATVLIMEVRDRCNRALPPASDTTPDIRVSDALNGGAEWALGPDGCTVSATELAAACGFSRVTLWRILKREDVRRFISVEHNYVYDRRLGKKRRTVSTYRVQMEDPLLEEDEARLAGLATDADQAERPERPERPAPQSEGGWAPAPTGKERSYPPPPFQAATEAPPGQPPRLQPETAVSRYSPKPRNVPGTIENQRLGPNDTNDTQGLRTSPAPTPPPATAQPPAAAPAQVRQTGQAGQPVEVDIWRRYPQLAHYVEEAERLLGDTHSRGFYLKALKQLHPRYMDVWQRALGLAREQQNIRRSRGALFTRLLRTFAAEAGVAL